MSDITDTIARTHRITAGDQAGGRILCMCGVWTASRASEGMLDVHGRHVSEVTEAQVRAQLAAVLKALPSPPGINDSLVSRLHVARTLGGES